jgi:3'-phosphoadenosine 5'-phosphosulfate sulfotransferase (PAPS reductase)/FAD synthetase
MRHIIPISGKDSLWTAIVQKRRAPDLPYEYMFNDTGAELPDTYEWLDKVEKYLDSPIVRVGENLEDMIYEQNFLPSPRARYCTRTSKIYPMEDWIGKDPAYVYYGIRADEQREGYNPNKSKKHDIRPMYPLVEEGQTLNDVYQGLHELGLLPPAFEWQALLDLTAELLGDKKSLLDNLHPVTKRQLFAWRSRTNCYFCFFQRRYEWIGLAEHYPDLFERACQLEEDVGSKNYTWIQGVKLRDYVLKRDAVILKRAKGIVKLLVENEDSLLNDDGDPVDLLQVVSCGLFCGK